MPDDQEREPSGVDPEDFLRALLKINPEDAEEVREAAAEKMRSGNWREYEPDQTEET